MKTLTVLFFALTLSVNITKAEDIKISDNSACLIEEANQLFIALISNAQYLEMETALRSSVSEESELLMEESLEIEEWMLDYSWIQKNEVILQEELTLELWMEHPQNWNIYSCK